MGRRSRLGIRSREAFGPLTRPFSGQYVEPAGLASAFAAAGPDVSLRWPHPLGIPSAQALGTPTMQPGPISAAMPSIISGEAFGPSTLPRVWVPENNMELEGYWRPSYTGSFARVPSIGNSGLAGRDMVMTGPFYNVPDRSYGKTWNNIAATRRGVSIGTSGMNGSTGLPRSAFVRDYNWDGNGATNTEFWYFVLFYGTGPGRVGNDDGSVLFSAGEMSPYISGFHPSPYGFSVQGGRFSTAAYGHGNFIEVPGGRSYQGPGINYPLTLAMVQYHPYEKDGYPANTLRVRCVGGDGDGGWHARTGVGLTASGVGFSLTSNAVTPEPGDIAGGNYALFELGIGKVCPSDYQFDRLVTYCYWAYGPPGSYEVSPGVYNPNW